MQLQAEAGTTVGASGLHLNTLKILTLVKFNMTLAQNKNNHSLVAWHQWTSEEKMKEITRNHLFDS